MKKILEIGGVVNTPINTYYTESAAELEEFVNVPVGSKGYVLTENELIVKMYRSTGWVTI